MMTKQQALDKLAKLLRLSTSPNEHEAKLAMTKAREIMDEYGIAEAEALREDVRKGTGIIDREFYTVDGCAMKYVWLYQLGRGVSMLFDGICVISPRLHGTSFWFVGTGTDREAMKMMFQHLWQSWKSIVERDLSLAKEKHVNLCDERLRFSPWAPRDTMKFKLGHGQGFATAIFQRAKEESARRESSNNVGTGLMVIKKGQLEKFKQKMGFKTRSCSQRAGTEDGKRRGFDSGMSVPLGGAISGPRAAAKIR